MQITFGTTGSWRDQIKSSLVIPLSGLLKKLKVLKFPIYSFSVFRLFFFFFFNCHFSCYSNKTFRLLGLRDTPALPEVIFPYFIKFCSCSFLLRRTPKNLEQSLSSHYMHKEVYLCKFLTSKILLLTFNREEENIMWPLPRGKIE